MMIQDLDNTTHKKIAESHFHTAFEHPVYYLWKVIHKNKKEMVTETMYVIDCVDLIFA